MSRSTYVGADRDEDVCNMARQDFGIAVAETTGQRLNAIAVTKVADIAQQVHGNFWVLYTQPHLQQSAAFTHTQ